MLPPARDELPVLQLGRPRVPWLLSDLAVRAWAEAAAVCLDAVGHGCTVEASIEGIPGVLRVILDAPTADEAMRKTHRNLKDATELGAVAVIASVVHDLSDELILDQAVEGTRIDYWLGRRGEGPLYQKKSRIEISGILREAPNNTTEYRIHKKRERLRKNPDERNATIAIVVFSAPKAVMEREHEPER